MKIKTIHIENFGKLKDYTVNLSEGLNEFYFENGFGKTTLSIFIKAMFYGMPPARENVKMERKKYMPWQGGNFGGYIDFEYEGKFYRVTRFFAKTPEGDNCQLLNLSTNKIVDLKGNELGETIFGVGRETFEMTAFFPQLNFSVISNQQMTANILGLDKFKYDLANLNTAIAIIKKKIAEIKRDKPKKEELDFIARSIKDCQFEISEQENRLRDISKKIEQQNKELSLLETTALSIQKEQEIKNQMQETKQKLEEELMLCQGQLNCLLLQINNINQEEFEESKLLKEKNNKRAVLHFSLLILGILGIVAGVVAWVLYVPIAYVACILILSFFAIGAGTILLILNKKSSKKNLHDYQKEKSAIDSQVNIYKEKIGHLQNSLDLYKDIDIMPKEQNQYENALYEARLNNQKLQHERTTIIQKMDNLLEKCELLKDEYDNKNARINSIEKQIGLLTKSKDFLIQANENVSSRFVQPANKILKEVLTKFDLRNREFIVDTNFDIKEITPIGVKEQEYFSQGYQDILAFCIRLYFLKEIYKQEKPFIILDDTFVNLDDGNMENAKQIIKELQKNYQIIYTCCHERCRIK